MLSSVVAWLPVRSSTLPVPAVRRPLKIADATVASLALVMALLLMLAVVIVVQLPSALRKAEVPPPDAGARPLSVDEKALSRAVCAAASAAVSIDRPAAVESEISAAGCVWLAAALPLSADCRSVWLESVPVIDPQATEPLLVNPPQAVPSQRTWPASASIQASQPGLRHELHPGAIDVIGDVQVPCRPGAGGTSGHDVAVAIGGACRWRSDGARDHRHLHQRIEQPNGLIVRHMLLRLIGGDIGQMQMGAIRHGR